MYAILICAVLGADKMPETFRKYFDRQEEVFDADLLDLRRRVVELEARTKAQQTDRARRVIGAELRKVQSMVAAKERQKAEAKPELPLSDIWLQVGDVGILAPCYRVGVVDERVVVKVPRRNGAALFYCLQGLEADAVPEKKPYSSKVVWRVVVVDSKEQKLMAYGSVAVLQPVNDDDLAKWRVKYLAEQKNQAP